MTKVTVGERIVLSINNSGSVGQDGRDEGAGKRGNFLMEKSLPIVEASYNEILIFFWKLCE